MDSTESASLGNENAPQSEHLRRRKVVECAKDTIETGTSHNYTILQ